jgi:hypothetical protein
MSLIWFPILVLGVWRATHLMAAEDGPGGILARLRKAAGKGFFGRLLDCFYCLSLWVAAPFALVLGSGWMEHALVWPALSGGAILLERFSSRPEPQVPAVYYEEPINTEDRDAMLWKS